MSSTNGANGAAATGTAASSPGPAATGGETPVRPPPRRADSLDTPIPDEAPPSYATAISNGDLRVAAGPSRMDFSGPPPMPEGMQARYNSSPNSGYLSQTPTGGNIMPGVGVGYGPRPQQNNTGYGNGSGTLPPPPQHPSIASGYPGAAAMHGGGGGGGRPSGPPPQIPTNRPTTNADHTPTETPVPGRPLLRGGQLLVYPKGYWCTKCHNTGYKNADPSHPCTNDWRKYGKAFNSALAHSYSISPRPGANATTTEATNFQRPLPVLHPAGAQSYPPPQHSYPGAYPPYGQPHANFRPPPPPRIQYATYGNPVPSNALYVQPGDPRIGGRLCNRCGGTGVETSFSLFIFDESQCRDCRGLGRVF